MLNSDLPIKKISEDLLNRQSFSSSLAKVMLEYSSQEAFAIGLYGKWGSGKTSVINMVLEQVQDVADDVIILRFNPWLCSDPKQLVSQFFKQLSTAIKMKQPKFLSACNLMEEYADAFELANMIPVAGNILSAILKILGKKAKSYKDTKTGDLQNIKNQIIERLTADKLKIIVTIDDIDRLSENEIAAVFQLVKSLADFPYTIYLLAFDYDVVTKALEKIQSGIGAEYLEKIIQVPFELPASNIDEVLKILFKKLEIIIGDFPEEKWDTEGWAELFHLGIKNYIYSIRDVIRFTNVFSLKYALLKDETDPVDLLGLTCIQVFEPMAYGKLPFYKEQLCGSRLSYSRSDNKEDEIHNAYNDITSHVSDKNREALERIINFLFPKTNSRSHTLMGGSRYYNHKVFLIRANIACPECFNRYFALTLESKAVPSSTLIALIFDSGRTDLIAGIIKLNREGKIISFLEALEAYSTLNKKNKITQERAQRLLESIIYLWDRLDNPEEESFFSMPFIWRLIFCTNALLEVIEPLQRYTILESLFCNPQTSLSAFSTMLREFEIHHNRFVDEIKHHEKQILAIDEVYNLETIFVERVSSELDSRALLDNDDARVILWMLEKISPSIFKEKTQDIISDDIILAKLIHNCVTHKKGLGKTVYKIWTVHPEDIQKYTDINVAYSKMLLFVKSKPFMELSDDIQEDIIAFIVLMEHPKDSSRYFDDNITAGIIHDKFKELNMSRT